LLFDIRSAAQTAQDKVVAEWTMTGTNTGEFGGLPPTQRAVSLPGLDVVETGPDYIKSVTGYFDSRAVPEQLGLQVLVQPVSVGPFSFGNSVAVQSGNKSKPGAFSITTIWNEAEQEEDIRAFSRATASEMLAMDGFIGLTLVRVGGRGVTISAWEKPEDTRQLFNSKAHRDAMSRFWKDLGDSAFTSVWTLDHFNPLWVRCQTCRKMIDYDKNSGQCACGTSLPDPPAYF
jgi:heme-degrading monooxygenase HmoA